MYELVELRREEIFTNSKVIAEGTGNKHEAVQAIISKYTSDIEDFGALRFEMRVLKHENYRGSTREKIYYLNEEQATFVITLLRNSKTVVKFKKELVRQFYAMRRFLLERQSNQWQDTRISNKQNRIKETDVIKKLVEYAKEQGSKHSDKLYITYTKLAKTVVNGKRDMVNIDDLNNLTLVERIILQTIEIDMSMDKHYKEIYKDCKDRIEQFKDIAYLAA
jgi:phage regulator Rha-like protein